MHKPFSQVTFFLFLALSGCATIIEPPKQTISINSDPQGAVCDVTRAGKRVANLNTPGIFTVPKSHNNLVVRCQKPGYASVIGVDESHNQGWVFGNLAFGGFIGAIVDLSTSADDVYGETIKIKMQKLDTKDGDIYKSSQESAYSDQ